MYISEWYYVELLWIYLFKKKKNELDPDLIPFKKYHRPKVKHKTIQLLEDSIGENPDDFGFGNDFGNIIPEV